jgi:hypothetical protein
MDKQYLDTIIATNQCTLKEYIYVYPRLLAEYKKLGEDCIEMYFIEEQIGQHFIHIDFAKKTQNKIRDDYDYKNYGTFEDWVKTVRSFDIIIVSLKSIIKFLETKKSELEAPQQVKDNKTIEVTNLKTKLHNDIFKDNAFEMWGSLFDSFKIDETCRTDVKFIFEEMKKDGLINKTVNQKFFLDWITENYDGLLIEKTSNHSRTKERISIYENAKAIYIK